MKTVKFIDLSSKNDNRSTRIKNNFETTDEMIERAVKKCYGKRCFFFRDNGLSQGYYGQIFESLRPTKNNSQPGNSSVTGRIRIDIE